MNMQTAIVFGVIGCAVAYLLRRAWRKFTSKTGCGCEHCPVQRRQGS